TSSPLGSQKYRFTPMNGPNISMSALKLSRRLLFSRSMFRYRNPTSAEAAGTKRHSTPPRRLYVSFDWLSEMSKPATPPRNQSDHVSVMRHTMRPPTIGSITLPLPDTFWFGKPSEASTHMNRPPTRGSKVSDPALPSDSGGRRYVPPNSKNSCWMFVLTETPPCASLCPMLT